MNKKRFITVMVVIWSVIIVALTVLLGYLLTTRNSIPFFYFTNSQVKGTTQDYSKSFDASGIKEIYIQAANADVNYSAGSSNSIEITVKNNSQSPINTESSGSTISVKQNTFAMDFFNFGFHQRSSITISVPASYKDKIRIGTASGDIKVVGDLDVSSVDFESASGDIYTDKIKADSVKLLSVSGNIKSKAVEGTCALKTTSGDLYIDDFNGSGSAKSVSGEVNCKLSNLTGSLDINSISGNVSLTTGDNISAKATVKSVSGDINTEIPMISTGKHNANITIGSGTNSISVSTVSGDINLKK